MGWPLVLRRTRDREVAALRADVDTGRTLAAALVLLHAEREVGRQVTEAFAVLSPELLDRARALVYRETRNGGPGVELAVWQSVPITESRHWMDGRET